MARGRILLCSAAAIVAIASAASGAGAENQADQLRIFAAASLTEAFSGFDRAPAYSFAGSDALETQIRNGAPADIFASASPWNTQRLFASRLVEKPLTFTSNRVALIVPRSNPARIRTIYDLRRKRVKLVVAGVTVPVGAYTRTVLRRLGLSSVLSKVVSEEPDVKSVTGKVALGQADAGFVYATDARPVRDKVSVIRIPERAQPRIRYEIAVVAESSNKAAARAWVRAILSPKGQRALRNAGFRALPRVAP
jgi:molybdate transport system substrate-binding protein